MKKLFPNTPFALGKSSWRQTGSTAIDLRRTANLPDDINFTACGWAVMDADTNGFANIVALEDATASAAAGIYLQTDSDGTTLTVLGATGQAAVNVGTLTERRPFFWAMTCSGTASGTLIGYLRFFNSNTLSSNSPTGTRSAFTPAILIFGDDTFDEPWNGRLWNIKVWDVALTARELLLESYSVRPISRPQSLHAWWPLEGSGNVLVRDYGPDNKPLTATGTGRIETFFLPRQSLDFDKYTLLSLNSTASGRTGTLSQSIGNITLNSASTLALSGSLSKSIGDITLNSQGAVALVGTLSKSIGEVTLSSTGQLQIQGSLSQSIGDITLVSTGSSETTGALNQSIGDITLSSTGALNISGSLSKSIGDIALSSTAQLALVGELSKSIGDITLSSTGSVAIVGALSKSIGDITLTSEGTIISGGSGVLNKSIGEITLSSLSSLEIQGITSQSIGEVTLTSIGTLPLIGSLNKSIGDITLLSAGSMAGVATTTRIIWG